MPARPKDQANKGAVTIDRPVRKTVELSILGTTPLICNRMSEKAWRELLLPSGRKNAAEKASTLKHDPIAEYRDSPYKLDEFDPFTGERNETLIAMMSSCFKGALGTAALDLPGATKAKIGRLTQMEGFKVQIFGIPQLFMTIVRMADAARTPDVRTRVVIPEWACRIRLSYISPQLRETTVFNLVAAAGMTAGIGDWRPEKGKGSFGQFELVDSENKEAFDLVLATGGREVQEQALLVPDFYDEETAALMAWYFEETERRGHKPTLIGSNGHMEPAARELIEQLMEEEADEEQMEEGILEPV